MYNNNTYLLLYKKTYNYNKHSHYTRRCIITILIYYYIRRHIMTTNISLYMKTYFSLYETMYNGMFVVIIHENVFLIIRDDV